MKKIWFFNFTDPLPSTNNKFLRRHESLALDLSNKGYDVTWVTDTFSHTQKIHFVGDSFHPRLKIIKLSSIGYSRNISLRRILHNIFLSISVFSLMIRTPKRLKPEIAMISFPPIEPSFVLGILSKIFGIKFLIDFRDLHPDIFYNVFKSILMKALMSIALIPYRLMVFCILHLSNQTFTTSPDVSNFLKHKYRLKQLPKSFYHWYKSENNLQENHNDQSFQLKIKEYIYSVSDPVVLSYCGALSRRLDFMNLVKAFKRLEDSSKILVLCGSGDQLEEIKQQASSCKNIFVAPNIPREGVSAIYNLSDYGLLPYPPDIDFQLAPPTKLSEMLSHNLKIICSENTYVHKNLKDKITSYYYKFNDFNSLIEVICQIQKVDETDTINKDFWSRNLNYPISSAMSDEIAP